MTRAELEARLRMALACGALGVPWAPATDAELYAWVNALVAFRSLGRA